MGRRPKQTFLQRRQLLSFSHWVIANSFVTPWTVVCQAPLSIGFPRQEYWSRLPFPFPGDLPDLEIEPMFPAWQANSCIASKVFLFVFFLTTEPLGSPYRWPKGTRKDAQHNQLLQKVQIKTTMSYHFSSVRMTKQGTQLSALWWPRWMGCGERRRSKREGIYVYTVCSLCCTAKRTQNCKATVPQLKNKRTGMCITKITWLYT